ncbi:cytochrome P450 [Thermomonospora cellulosilytica]|uniref:Cytochrome P450 n=1 Tax=Thermomonospora cellulosilytica TaxID=1411118 RepID=A0A7W3N3L8_9ACTN|nr:cytochrome P450 [Thermomonospora cellulosilytica]MBA9006889.1 cytochrome P450 [Thermomonospora cellulosilytica]
MSTESAGGARPGGCPAHGRIRMYDEQFAVDPHGAYARMRPHGAFAPVEIAPGVPATLAIGYDAVLEVMRDDRTFSRNPSTWQQTVPPDCPVLPMMGYRPNVLFTDGAVHARLRGTITDAFARLDPGVLRGQVERHADALVRALGPLGEADLMSGYVQPLPMLVYMDMFGCPPAIAERLVFGMAGIFEATTPAEAEKANNELNEGIYELIALKRSHPGEDVTSWLLAHPAELTDDEVHSQLVLLMGAGTEPEQNLIGNALRLLLSDDRFAGDLSGGSLPIEDALDEVLWTDPPLANYGARFPLRDVEMAGHRLPAHQPVVMSYAAANTDPAKTSDQRTGNRAHLAWGAGPHACPARNHARLIASIAIERLLDGLPDMTLAVPVEELRWRIGMFHRGLVSLPVRYPPVHFPAPATDTGAQRRPAPALTAPAPPAERPAEGRGLMAALRRWWNGE